jgi:Cytochrome P450
MSDRRHALGDKIAIVNLIPILRFPLVKLVNQMKLVVHDMKSFIKEKFKQHLTSYQPEIIRDFADALIAAKEEAIKETKSSAVHLTDANLTLTLLNLFIAGCN